MQDVHPVTSLLIDGHEVTKFRIHGQEAEVVRYGQGSIGLRLQDGRIEDHPSCRALHGKDWLSELEAQRRVSFPDAVKTA